MVAGYKVITLKNVAERIADILQQFAELNRCDRFEIRQRTRPLETEEYVLRVFWK